jgi:hypothetical protein
VTNAGIRDLSYVFQFDIAGVLPNDVYTHAINLIPLDGFAPGPQQRATKTETNKIDFVRAGDISFYFLDENNGFDPRYITLSSEYYDFTINRTDIIVSQFN